jgi:peroxiredoxin
MTNYKTNVFIFLLLVGFFYLPTAVSAQKKSTQPKGKLVGDVVESFSAKDVNDSIFSLEETLKKGSVVLIFIRGQWCPVCNRHMSSIQDSISLITEKGATFIIVSPEKPEFIEKTAEKTGVKSTILFDEGMKIAHYFDVAFKPKSTSTFFQNLFLGAKLKKSHTEEELRLPIPATYIIGKDSKIVWRHFDKDYTKRASINEILTNIPR